jgi:lipoyl(octanoyl) transferase
MKPTIILENIGKLDYPAAWELQKKYFEEIIQDKTDNKITKNTLILVEHHHVYTLGKNGERQNLLISDERLREINAIFVQVDRGGDITYHGPGQLVVYPVFDLDNFGIRTREFVYRLEESVIKLLKSYQIETSRMDSAAGVWIDAGNQNARKICSVGIKSSRGATMHGIALNINTDLRYFSYINPCGFVDKSMTSMQIETNNDLDFNEIKERLSMFISAEFRANLLTQIPGDPGFPSC